MFGEHISETDVIRSDVYKLSKRLDDVEDTIKETEKYLRGEKELGTWEKLGECENDPYKCSVCERIFYTTHTHCPLCKTLMKKAVKQGEYIPSKTIREGHKLKGENDNV